MKRTMQLLSVLAWIFAGCLSVSAAERVLLHTNEDGFAVDGFDPVAFFEEAEPVKGKGQYRLVYKGALYLFISQENLRKFRENPDKYEPKFGGYCPVSLAQDRLVPGKAQNFKVVDGELYLMHDSEAARDFRQKQVAMADKFWKQQVKKNGLIYLPEQPGN